MKPAPNRLAGGELRPRGTEIDRGRGFSFRLDGHEIDALPGDTLLSAALASGLIGAGLHDGQPVALDERFAPPVLARSAGHRPARALPMGRTPAAPGLDLVTLSYAAKGGIGQRIERLAGLVPARRRRLGLSFDTHSTDPWFDAPPEQQLSADVVVIGGGLGGLGAALAAGRRGERVMLIERQQWLGGNARFFGSIDEEESPDDSIDRLSSALKSLHNVMLLTRTEAFALFEGSVRINQVQIEDGVPTSRVLAIDAPRIVLATGTLERLPIFAGNRLPGVVTARAAFQRADRFGVWIGKRALLSTTVSVAYRAATLGKDAGMALERIADSRINPQSRFVEFSKAYGIPLGHGMIPRRAEFANRRGALLVTLAHTVEGRVGDSDSFTVDQLIVAAASQPDLSLWHMAGGVSRWNVERARLEAHGTLEGIVLAGAVAGYRNAAACIASGQAAIAQLFGKPVPGIDDPTIDPIFETPDDPTPIAAPDPDAEAGAYLDGGASLALRPTRRMLARRRWFRRAARWGLGDDARSLGVADVAAGVQLGAIPPNEAAVVAQERCVPPGDIVDAGRPNPVGMPVRQAASAAPPYLAGRFGPRAAVWAVSSGDNRDFEIGCLVFANADQTDPAQALGVVFAAAPTGRKGGLAVIGRTLAQEGGAVFVRDISVAVPATLIDPLRPVETSPAGQGDTAAGTKVDIAAATALLAGTAPVPPSAPVVAARDMPAPEGPAVATAASKDSAIPESAVAENLLPTPADGPPIVASESSAPPAVAEPVAAAPASSSDSPPADEPTAPEPAVAATAQELDAIVQATVEGSAVAREAAPDEAPAMTEPAAATTPVGPFAGVDPQPNAAPVAVAWPMLPTGNAAEPLPPNEPPPDQTDGAAGPETAAPSA